MRVKGVTCSDKPTENNLQLPLATESVKGLSRPSHLSLRRVKSGATGDLETAFFLPQNSNIHYLLSTKLLTDKLYNLLGNIAEHLIPTGPKINLKK